MTRRLVASYLVITAFVLAVLVFPLGVTFASREKSRLLADIERDARVLATLVEDVLERDVGELPASDIAAYAARTNGRVVIVDEAGISLVDTLSGTPSGRDFSTRPEVLSALGGALATGERDSATLGESMMYVAVPVGSGGRVHGAVRVSYPRATLDDRIRETWVRLGLLSAVVIVAALGVGWVLAQSVTRPVRLLQVASGQVARGDLGARVPEAGPPELRSLAAAFNDMTEGIDAAMQRERAFSADVSHQLRTPLTALRLRLESLEGAVTEDGHADLDAALRETERLSELVNMLLALARQGEGHASLVEVDLVEIGHGRIETWRTLADERDVRLVVDAPGPVSARALPGAVEQIVDNLLDNALEVAPAGSVARVVVTATPTTATLRVIDEGTGMSDDELARAFDRYWTTTGTGLGLAIVRRLAAASRGTAEARRAPNGGLDVGVTLRRGR